MSSRNLGLKTGRESLFQCRVFLALVKYSSAGALVGRCSWASVSISARVCLLVFMAFRRIVNSSIRFRGLRLNDTSQRDVASITVNARKNLTKRISLPFIWFWEETVSLLLVCFIIALTNNL